MSARTGFQVSVKIDGVTEILARFNKLGNRQAIGNAYLRIGSLGIAEDMVGWTKAAASAEGRQAATLGMFVKTKTDRVPVVTVAPTGTWLAGSSVSGSKKTFNALAGSEFGARTGTGHGFLAPWTGKNGTWFFPTAEAHSDEVAARWYAVVGKIADDFNAGRLD